MLKYLKRQKSRRRSRETDDTNNTAIDCNSSSSGGSSLNANVTDKRNSLRSTSSFCDEIFFEEFTAAETEDDDTLSCGASSLKSLASTFGVGANSSSEDIFKYHSRLSMSLTSIVNDPNCLSYFVQFLETKNALALIKFYLDIENFKAAAKSQFQKEQNRITSDAASTIPDKDHFPEFYETIQLAKKSNWKKHCKQSICESDHFDESITYGAVQEESEDEKINNNVPELKTLCDLSMRKPITDDEKSKICAETNKQLTKCTNNNHNSNSNNNNLSSSKIRTTSEISLLSNNSTTTNHEFSSTTGSGISAASLNDAMAIYQKYLNANAIQYVSLPVAILEQISLLLCKRSSDKIGCKDYAAGQQDDDYLNDITTNCFNDAQEYVFNELETKFLNEFLQSSYYARYCVELIESTNNTRNAFRTLDNLNIYDILYSEVALFFFMEFLEQHDERECLDFWTTAINFRKSFTVTEENTSVEAETQADAMQIYEKFFSLQADKRLWSSDRLRSWVEEHICAPGKISQAFDLPLQVLAKYLERKYLSEFLTSQLFENYVNELKSKINADQGEQNTNGNNEVTTEKIKTTTTGLHKLNLRRMSSLSSGGNKHRKTLSDCSNENSRDLLKNIVSTQNTLLAMMDPVHKQSSNASGNLQIDSSQLNNPNLLWQRAYNTDGGLSFGRVNSLGRYERDFDVFHDLTYGCGGIGVKHNSWSFSVGGNKLKNAVRKLVNLPEDKVQEEIAWQVAEMIIKDVTNVTLQQNSDCSERSSNLPASKTL